MSELLSTPKPPHILIAGGCHVNGWPIGDSSSFVHVLMESDPCANPSTIAPINLHNCSSLVRHLQRQPADVVILQLGNYETLGSVKKHLRSVFHLSRHPHSNCYASSTGVPLDPDTIFPSTPAWRLRVLSKQIYSRSIGQINPPLFDAEAFRSGCAKLIADFTQLQESAPKLVVFLSPTPCADHLVRHYRSQAARILSDVCHNASDDLPFRVHYLDTAQALGIGPDTAQPLAAGLFVDDLHLNRRGHQLLGTALASVLQHAHP